MKTRNIWTAVLAAALCLLGWRSPATAAQALPSVADPTCAVIEQADYDVHARAITVRGRSNTPFTLTIYDEDGGRALLTAAHPQGGKWSATFDIVDPQAVPGLVKVQGAGDCVATRRANTGPLALQWFVPRSSAGSLLLD